jgi:anti-sigma factor RsiW
MMACSEVSERLTAWQDRELSPGEHALVSEHLERCERCRVRERRLARATPGPMPKLHREVQEALWTKLDAALDEAALRPATPGAVRRPLPVPSAFQLVYAAALLAAVLWGWFNHVTAQNLQAALDTERARHVPSAEIPADQFRPVSFVPGEAAKPSDDVPQR